MPAKVFSVAESGAEPVPAVAADRSAAIEAATAALEGGGSVVLPTDTVYGVAALPHLPGATGALFDLKGRDADQPIAVLVAGAEQGLALVDLDRISDEARSRVRALAARHWPGALTLVLPRRREARGLELGGDPGSIGVRCPASRLVRELADRVGPLAVTSANRHGEPTPRSASEAASSLAGMVDVVLDAGPCGSVASTVLDARSEPWVVLRQGDVVVEPAVQGRAEGSTPS